MPEIDNNMLQSGQVYCPDPNYATDITWVREINGGRLGAKNKQQYRRYVRNFLVRTRHSQVPAHIVRDAAELPDYGNNYIVENPEGENWKDDDVAVVEKIATIHNEDDPCVWHVSVVYEVEGSPLSQYWEVTWDEIEYEKAATKNIDEDPWNGDPIVNSAGDPFDPPITIEDGYSQLIISRWESEFDIDYINSYKHRINNAPVTIDGKIFPEYSLKVRSIKAFREIVNGLQYWRVTITVDYNPLTWKVRVLDAGYRRLDDQDPPNRIHILDALRQPVVIPHPLDGEGKPLAKDAEPHYLEFMPRQLKDFTNLYLDYAVFGIPGVDQEAIFAPDEGAEV